MNIADIAKQVGTVYDRTLHTTLTLPYSGFDQIAIAQNDIATSAVINNAINKLYDNYIQLYRYSNVASNVIPISSIGFIGALPNNPPTYNVTTDTKLVTSYITTPVYSITPSTRTEISTVTSYKTVTQDLTSFNLSSTVTYYENLFYYSAQLDNTKYWKILESPTVDKYQDKNGNSIQGSKPPTKIQLASNTASPFNTYGGVYKLIEGQNNTVHGIFQNRPEIVKINNTFIASVYVKAAERTAFWMAFDGEDYHVYDLTNGETSVTSNGVNSPFNAYTIYIGNGWYQCVLQQTKSNDAGIVAFGPAIGVGTSYDKSVSYTGNGSSGIYLYGPQLIFDTVLYPYMDTHDTLVGTLANSPVNQDYILTFTQSTNWAVPAGITSVSVYVVGGGGGWATPDQAINDEAIAGGQYYSAGAGGGGQSYSANYTVNPGQIIHIDVGGGGGQPVTKNGHSSTTKFGSNRGQTSSFGTLCATGGQPGTMTAINGVSIGGVGGTGNYANGGSGSSINGGPGGNGTLCPLNNLYYGGGGSGSAQPRNLGGLGGGGSGSDLGDRYGKVNITGVNGLPNTGGGAGGVDDDDYAVGGSGVVIVKYTQTANTVSSVTPLAVTTTAQIINITEESTLVPILTTNATTYTTYLSTVRYVTTTQITPVAFTVYTPTTTLEWYTLSSFTDSSQFLPLATTQYNNLDNIVVTAGGINSSVSPNKYVVFASTGTDLIALTGDVYLNNISVALSTNIVAAFSDNYFLGINRIVLDPITNYLYVLDKAANLIHYYDASGFLTDDNVLANKLVYVKSMGGKGDYDAANLFNSPESIIIFDSKLYVLDSGNSCIKQYDNKLNWITTHRLFRDFSGNYPIDLTTDINGDIYVLTNTNKLLQYKNNIFNAGVVITLDSLSDNEYYQSVTTSVVNKDIFYLTTNRNVYKKFFSSITDTIGTYLFNRFNVSSNEIIKTFTSLINSVNGSDTNVIFSTCSGSGKFGFYYDNINLDSVLVTDNFDVYPLSSIQTNTDEYLQNWVFNKSIAKLMVNHTRFRDLVYSRFLYEPDNKGIIVYSGTRYLRPEESLSVSFDQNMENFIGCNEIFQNNIVNRSLKTIFDAQVSIFNMLQLDVRTHLNLNIPVYIN